MVLRYEGPKGGPGMQEMLGPTSLIMGMGLGEKVGAASPTAASPAPPAAPASATSPPRRPRAGPSAWCKDGDAITIDVEARTIQPELPAAELERRREGFKPKRKEVRSPWLRRYAHLVTNAASGAVLKSDSVSCAGSA